MLDVINWQKLDPETVAGRCVYKGKAYEFYISERHVSLSVERYTHKGRQFMSLRDNAAKELKTLILNYVR